MSRFFTKAVAVSCGVMCSALPAAAEQLLVEYVTTLSARDTFNSRGATINNLCGVIQQDRANVHTFDKADSGDSVDFIFDTRERRALMSGKCEFNGAVPTVAGIRSGDTRPIFVRVFAEGNTLTRVVVAEAAG